MDRRLWSTAGGLALALAGGVSPAEGQILHATWIYPVESILFSDFDPFSPGGQPDLFSLEISGSGVTVLWVEVRMIRPDNVTIFTGWSAPVALTGAIVRITNADLASTSEPFAIKDQADFYSGADDLYDKLQETGRFPAGTYEFDFRLCNPSSIPDCPAPGGSRRAVIQREVSNPTRVDLLGPGRPFGEAPPVVTSPSPNFLWTTDSGLVGAPGDYLLRVARVEDAASGEEAIRGFAVWDVLTHRTSETYPGSAEALPLAPGAAYAWQVTREVRTSGGIELLESPIYWFRMSGATGGTESGGSGGGESASAQVAQLAELLELGPWLNGFTPTGLVLVDGTPVPLDSIQDLLRRIISGDATIQSITVR